MKKISTYVLLVLTVIAGSCKKKSYPDSSVDGGPMFYFRGTVNNVQTDINAGDNDYFMYSKYEQGGNGVYTFIGNLAPQSCSGTCANSISIQINDYKISGIGSNVQIDSSLVAGGNYPINHGGGPTGSGPIWWTCQFYPVSNKGIQYYSWNYGDGSPTDHYPYPTHVFKKAGFYNICLSLTDSGGCSNNLCNVQKIGVQGCRASVSVASSASSISFTSTLSGLTPTTSAYNYSIDFGDGSTPTVGVIPTTSTSVQMPPLTHSFSANNSYLATLRASDVNNPNDSVRLNFHLATQSSAQCATNYVMTSTPIPNYNSLSNVTINWTDANGKLYSSNHANQPNNSYFQILSVEDYGMNENNEPAKKLHVKFSCNVYDTNNNMITINNAEAVILVAYK